MVELHIGIALFLGIQSTDIFSGNYKKSCFAFERRFAKAQTLTSQAPPAGLVFSESQIPPEMEQRTFGLTSTMRNIFDRLTGNEKLPRLPEMEERPARNTASESKITGKIHFHRKHCRLTLVFWLMS